jgi:hypothetical protein
MKDKFFSKDTKINKNFNNKSTKMKTDSYRNYIKNRDEYKSDRSNHLKIIEEESKIFKEINEFMKNISNFQVYKIFNNENLCEKKMFTTI